MDYFRRFVIISLVFVSMALWSCGQYRNHDSGQRPNVVLFLVDDLGWTDLGCYGSEFYQTPNIDAFTQSGMLFTRAYSPAPVCSPSRAAILTGKNPARLHLTDWIGPDKWHPKGKLTTPQFAQQLPLEEVTIAERLSASGYSTCFLGKWHLGGEEYFPQHQGFDRVIGAHEAGGPPSYFYPYRNNSNEIADLAATGRPGEYLTERLTDDAIHFLDTVTGPFFLYFSHFAVHEPLQAREVDINKYRQKAQTVYGSEQEQYIPERAAFTKTRQDHPIFSSMVESVDDSFGRLLNKIEMLGAIQNTIILFVSDNGGLSTRDDTTKLSTSVLPLRAGKGWLYEGGVRVPMIVSWGDKIKGGSTTDVPVVGTDLFPTILEMVGLDPVPHHPRDGESIASLLLEGEIPDRKNLYFHYPHYHVLGQSPASAVIAGQYKLIHWYDDGITELYDLSADPGEKNDLKEEMPGLSADLLQQLEAWLDRVNAQRVESQD